MFCCAGAINWSHQLFSRVKLTMSKLTAVEPDGSTWRQLPVGQQVHECYTTLAKQVMQFEKQWFQGWRDTVDDAAMRYLKQPIFARQPETGGWWGMWAIAAAPCAVLSSAVTSPARESLAHLLPLAHALLQCVSGVGLQLKSCS